MNPNIPKEAFNLVVFSGLAVPAYRIVSLNKTASGTRVTLMHGEGVQVQDVAIDYDNACEKYRNAFRS